MRWYVRQYPATNLGYLLGEMKTRSYEDTSVEGYGNCTINCWAI